MTFDATSAFVIDFSDVPSNDPVPAGIYAAEIVEVKPGKSKAGHPKMDVQWRIVSGEHENRRVFQTLSFKPEALFAVKNFLVGLSYPQDFSGQVNPEELAGKGAFITIAVETSNQIDPSTNQPYSPRNVVKKVSQDGPTDVMDLF